MQGSFHEHDSEAGENWHEQWAATVHRPDLFQSPDDPVAMHYIVKETL